MKAHSSKRVVYAALIGNSAIAVMKFIVAFVSGSAAMLAEAFHSSADSANQALLLLGLRRSQKPPDEKHPFGYGKELYFWAFVVAVSIFFVGAALSIYEGINKIIHPHAVSSIYLLLGVLGASMVFEAYSWRVAFTEARKAAKGASVSGFIKMAVRTKDPTIMIVLFEDTAAMLGLIVASAGISISYYTGTPVIDAFTSVIIGVILLGVALFLAWETKELLIGESATKEHRLRILGALSTIKEIEKCGPLMTMHMGPEDILVNLDIAFVDGLSTEEIEEAIDRIESRIKEAVPQVTKIFIEAESFRKKPGADRR